MESAEGKAPLLDRALGIAGYLLGSLGCDGRFGAERYEGVNAEYAGDLLLVSGRWEAPARLRGESGPSCQR